MFEKLGLTRMAQALAAHSGNRLSVIARNVANADTPRYQAQDLPDFAGLIANDATPPLRASRPGHLQSPVQSGAIEPIFAPDQQAPNGNNVSLDMQMMKSVQARQSQEMALAVYRTSASIVRLSLGRTGG